MRYILLCLTVLFLHLSNSSPVYSKPTTTVRPREDNSLYQDVRLCSLAHGSTENVPGGSNSLASSISLRVRALIISIHPRGCHLRRESHCWTACERFGGRSTHGTDGFCRCSHWCGS